MSAFTPMADPLHQHQSFTDARSTPDERTYATFNHLVGLISLIGDAGTGLLSILGALIMWRIKADQSPFLDDHGREAVNFQISILFYAIVGMVVFGIFTIITFGVGVIVAGPLVGVGVLALFILRLVGCIRGAIAANRGQYYRYPMCIRFLQGPADR